MLSALAVAALYSIFDLRAMADSHMRAVTYHGRLVDWLCWNRMRSGRSTLDGSDIINSPQDHTKHCLKVGVCVESGYYLAVKCSNGSYAPLFNLANHASTRAAVKQWVDALPDNSEGNVIVTVTGHNNNGNIEGGTITACTGTAEECDVGTCVGSCSSPYSAMYGWNGCEATAADVDAVTYHGRLVDWLCWNRARSGMLALDGSDIVNSPQDHTKHCLKVGVCVESGYYLAVRCSNGSYAPLFNLANDNSTRAAVEQWVDALPDNSEGDISVTVTGRNVNGNIEDGTITTCVGTPDQCDVGTCTGSCVSPYSTMFNGWSGCEVGAYESNNNAASSGHRAGNNNAASSSGHRAEFMFPIGMVVAVIVMLVRACQ